MSDVNDDDIIKKFIKLLENNLLFKGSPKGYSASTPYKKPTITPPKGKSNHDIEDYLDVGSDEKEESKKKTNVAKYFSNREDEIEDE